jgi:hypothetical protein
MTREFLLEEKYSPISRDLVFSVLLMNYDVNTYLASTMKEVGVSLRS